MGGMDKINDKPFWTIAEIANIWADLSPNVKAKIHQWMARNVFKPEIYAAPRTKRHCLCSTADAVTVAILHWLFFVGVRYETAGMMAFYQEDRDPVEMALKLISRQWGRAIQHFLEDFAFQAHVVAYPIRADKWSPLRGKEGQEVASVKLPAEYHGKPFHAIHLIQTCNLEKAMARFAADYETVPLVTINAGGLYKHLQTKLATG
jgi:hypothetical protein